MHDIEALTSTGICVYAVFFLMGKLNRARIKISVNVRVCE